MGPHSCESCGTRGGASSSAPTTRARESERQVSGLRKRAKRRAALALALVALAAVAVALAGVCGSGKCSSNAGDNEPVQLTGSQPTDSQPTPSPTAAPTTRPLADLVLQLVNANIPSIGPGNGEVIMGLYDGAVINVDEVGISLFSVVADASEAVKSVLFDNGEDENTRPFSRCGDIDKTGAILHCSDLRNLGNHTVWAIAYPEEDEEGIPYPKVTVTFSIVDD